MSDRSVCSVCWCANAYPKGNECNCECHIGNRGMNPEDKYKIRERCVYCKWYRQNEKPPTAWGICTQEEANMYLKNDATIAELFGCIYWEDVLLEAIDAEGSS